MFTGGGPHGTEGREEDKPCKREVCFEASVEGGSGCSSCGELGVDDVGSVAAVSSFVPSSSFEPVRLTSSREEVDSLCAVRSGDLAGFCFRGVSSSGCCDAGDEAASSSSSSSWSSSLISSLSFLLSGESACSEGASVARGVVTGEPPDRGLSVRERVVFCAVGASGSWEDWASSKLS